MTAAQFSRRTHSQTKLLVISRDNSQENLRHLQINRLPELLKRGDVVVINDAATLPASFYGTHRRTGLSIEMRLASLISEQVNHPARWLAVFFGEGSWRTDTEFRSPSPPLQKGDMIDFGSGLFARIGHLSPSSHRLAVIEFISENSSLLRVLYKLGHPIQYSHLREDLALWDVQTAFAGPPVALEAPSAAFPFNWELMEELKKTGVILANLTHSAGISSTGDALLDRELPLPERYWIPAKTARVINTAKKEGRRVIAIGTSVTRALESSATQTGWIREGQALARLIITPAHQHQIVTGILSGFHESGASHLRLLGSFVSPAILDAAYREAEKRNYLSHEFGDSCLIL